MTTRLPNQVRRNTNALFLVFSFLFLMALPLSAQNYTTTGASTNWEDPAAWNCQGGGCASRPYPDNDIAYRTVTINHDIIYDSQESIKLYSRGVLIVNNAKLEVSSRIKLLNRRAELRVNQGQVLLGSGMTNVEYQGDEDEDDEEYYSLLWNYRGKVILDQSCLTLFQGNFYNLGSVQGNGSVKTESGRIKNYGSWAREILYFSSKSSYRMPGSPSTEEEVAAVCVACRAGDAGPVLDAGVPTLFCAEDALPLLDSYVSGSSSQGAPLTWSTNANPLVVEQHIAGDQPLANPGTYYAFYYDAENSCASPVIALELIRNPAITVEVNSELIYQGESITLMANASGGNENFSYLWSTGETTQSITVSPDVTTDYSVVVSDSFAASSGTACSADGLGEVTVNPEIVVAVNSEDINEGQSVTLTANPSGGNGNYRYLWSPGGATTQSIEVSPEETTAFTVIVSDDFQTTTGTTSTGSNSGTVNVNPAIVVEVSGPSATVNNESIIAGQSVTLTAAPTGGTAPYAYLWSTGETTESITVTPSVDTDYTVTVTDSFIPTTGPAASAEATSTVTVNPELTVMVNSESINEGESVTLTAEPTGGTAPYAYVWSTGETTESITVTPDATTDYTVTVTDAFIPTTGPTASAEATSTVTVNPALTVMVNSESINEGESVTLTAEPTGGTAPYAYAWSTGETTESITVTPDATTDYTVTVTDAFVPTTGDPASAEATSTVTVNPELTLAVNSESINQGESVLLTADPDGGTAPYAYAWSTGETTESITVIPDATTDYTVTVTDSFIPTTGPAASAEATGTVTVNPELTVMVNSESINQGESVLLTADPDGGTAPYAYLWSTGETTESITVTPSVDTDYTVMVTDAFIPTTGPAASAEATSTVTVNPELTLTVNSESINEGESVLLTATPTGGTAPYAYLWSTGETTESITVTPLVDTDYTVTVTDAFIPTTGPAASAEATSTVTVNPAIAVTVEGGAVCIGEQVTLTAVTSGGNGNYTFLWSTGDTTPTIEVTPEATTEYTVEVRDDFQSTTESVSTVTAMAMVTVNPQISVEVASQTVCRGESITLTATPAGGNGTYTFVWFDAEGTQVGTGASISVSPMRSAGYTVSVSDTFATSSENGCTAEGTGFVTVENCDLREATEDEDVILLHGGKLSNALAILGQNGFDPTNAYNDFLYKIRIDAGVPKVLVQIVVADGQFNNLLGQLTSIGVQSGVLPNGDFLRDYDAANPAAYVSCYVPVENLLVLDDSPFLIQVLDGKLALTNTGAVLSEGVAAMRANIARLGWEVTGEGITIGVISDSFDDNNGYLSDQLGADLPGPSNPNQDQKVAVDVLEDLDDNGSDEGRAMLQLIHDVAPDASLKFATGFNGKYNFASQIEALRLAGCDIIVDDVQYIDEAMWKDDVVAQEVNNTVDAGVMYFSAAGNFGAKSIEQVFTPAPAPFETFHDWGGGNTEQTLTLDPGFYIISLQWDDNHASLGEGGARVDLNAYLGESPDILDFGSNVVNLGKDPMDFLYFVVLNPTTTNLLIERAEGSDTGSISFKYVVFRSGDTGEFNASPALEASTVVGHANAEKNFTVGAVRFDRVDPIPVPQQSSSDGGTTTNNEVRSKPDAMGPTGGDTTVPIGPDFDGDGQPNFFGTSAAAPHVAAVAAMILEAGTKFGADLSGATDPEFTVRNLLLQTAVDMGDPLKSGAGFVRADLALGAIANPTPNLISLNFDEWLEDNPGFVPGQGDFVVNYEGQNFTEESVVFFQGEELPTTFVNSETLTVTIPEFTGNGNGNIFTPPLPGAIGDDGGGGTSETVGFFDIPAKNVILRPNDITRFYGTSVDPVDNPELFGFTVVDAETGEPLPQEELDLFYDETLFPVTYSTTDQLDSPTSVTFSVILNVDLDNVDPGILELFSFDDDGDDENGEIQAGNLTIDPTHVEISVEYPETLVYGEPFPGIDYIFNYVDDDGNPVPIAQSEKDKYEIAHRNAFRLVNSVAVIANGRFRLVNEGETNRFRLVNCEDPDPEVNRFRLVNGECEPEINFDEPDGTTNRFRLVNQTFYVSQEIVDESTPLSNRFRLVNGDSSDQPWDENTKIIEIDPDLFANANRFRLVNGRNLTNLFRLVNDNEYDLVQPDGTTNRFRLVNGVEFSEGAASYDGELINRFRLVNGRSFRLVNDGTTNRFRLVNADETQPDPFAADSENSVVLFNSSEGSEVGTDPSISVFPVNFITGKDAGIQYVGTGRVFNNNFVATSTPVPVEILPAPLEVTAEDITRTYGTIPSPEEFMVDLTLLDPQLQYDDTLEDVFPEGLNFELDCEECDVPGSPHSFSLGSEGDSDNYDITFTAGLFNVLPFDLTLTVNPGTITYGDEGPFDFGFTLSAEDPAFTEADLPFGETGEDIFGTLLYSPLDGCDFEDTTSILTQVQPDNYNVTYLDGELTVENAELNIIVSGTSYIDQGDPIPDTFGVTVEGLVCDDPTPFINNFTILDASGNPVTGDLAEGVYDVIADLSTLSGYEFYNVSQTPGKIYVNPSVGCNERIRTSDLCKSPANLQGEPRIITLLRFTYNNRTDVPIYVPRGRDNQLKGNAYFVGELPELFLPGEHTFEIYTDGRKLQWEIKTPGCGSVSKSPSGSNANPCSTSLTSNSIEVDSFNRELDANAPKAYPNPATDYLTLFVGDMTGDVRVTVFDEVGRQLMARDYTAEGQDEVYLDISALKEGILMIRTENQGESTVFRIIKN